MRFRIEYSDSRVKAQCLRFVIYPLEEHDYSNKTTIWYDFDLRVRYKVFVDACALRHKFRCLKRNDHRFLLHLLEDV